MTAPQLFDDWPTRYDLWFDTPLGKAVLGYERAVILALLRPGHGEMILDAGSGTGIFTGAFVAHGADVVELDVSFSMLRRAKEKHAAGGYCAVTADMTELPFPDGVFDKSVSVTAVEFILDARRAVAELFRVTKRGGVIVVATLNSLSPWAARRRANAQQDADSLFHQVIFRSPAQLLEASPVPGITRTAVHFGKEDAPDDWHGIEQAGYGSDTGAFVAARWEKP